LLVQSFYDRPSDTTLVANTEYQPFFFRKINHLFSSIPGERLDMLDEPGAQQQIFSNAKALV
jgi:hypothetical protein